jgi:hypothetical protein
VEGGPTYRSKQASWQQGVPFEGLTSLGLLKTEVALEEKIQELGVKRVIA